MHREGKEAGLGRERNWSVTHSEQKLGAQKLE